MLKSLGRRGLEGLLEQGEQLIVFARGQLQESLGHEVARAYLPLSTKNAACAIGVTDRRVVLVRVGDRPPSVISIPPTRVRVLAQRRILAASYLKLEFDGGRKCRLYLSAGFWKDAGVLAEAITRFAA